MSAKYAAMIALILAVGVAVHAQDLESDLSLIAQKTFVKSTTVKVTKVKRSPLALPGHLALTFYQKIISPQISASCLYEVSCSRQSRALIQRFGIVKGVFLSADRLSRCNGHVGKNAFPSRIAKSGKLKDDVVLYSNAHHHGR